MKDYESPIEILYNDFQNGFENDIEKNVISTCISYGIIVDKDELIKALQYDRAQYDKGYKRGFKDGYQSVIDKLIEYIGGNHNDK